MLNYAGRRFFRDGRCCDIAPSASPTIERRSVLSGMAGIGLSSTLGASASIFVPATPASAGLQSTLMRQLIDVHSHIVPPFYLAENRERIAGSRGGQISAAWLEWQPQKALDAMDEHGVATAVLSLSTPGVWFGDAEAARRTARQCNDYAAELARSHPRRFGLFSALPLPDTEGSLREIEYALDVLKADGIGLLTSYGDKWLGDPFYQPVFEELNRRKAVVFVHPTTPTCCRTLMPGIATVMAEVPQDTTRTVISLLFSGTFTRFADIRFIFCHAGGSVPVLAARMTQYGPKDLIEKLPHGVDYELKRLYYDIAVSGHQPAIAALTSFVPASQILFGSDFPYRALGETAESLPRLDLSAAGLQAIGRDNALKLLPNLARS
jgi:predicted TIM-barrel fold metal-dependent hydrolase